LDVVEPVGFLADVSDVQNVHWAPVQDADGVASAGTVSMA
jgi:hypothetical protein